MEIQLAASGRWLMLHDGSLLFEGGAQSLLGSRATIENGNVRTCLNSGACLTYARPRTDVAIESVDIRPDSISLVVGNTRNVFATTIPYSAAISIFVKDTTIATMGTVAVRGRAPGTTYVVATAGTKRDSSKVLVRTQ